MAPYDHSAGSSSTLCLGASRAPGNRRSSWRAGGSLLAGIFVAGAATGLARGAAAQERLPGDLIPPPAVSDSSVEVAPGSRYAAGPGWRWYFGERHRDVWTSPARVPVLDPDMVGGGLRPVRRGGGLQTLTLHFRDTEGRYYLFRSIDKRVNPALPEDLRETPVGAVLQDQISAMHPGGAWVVDRLQEAVGVPRTEPRLYVMPDHPVLGDEHRDFAGRLGMLVESPDHGPDGTLHFQGASRVLSSDDVLEVLRESPTDRVDAVGILEARLLDLLVGDSDRGFRQWRWLRYGRPGAWTWRGFPMDRDFAFITGDGIVGTVGRWIEPKFVRFDATIDDEALTEAEPELDRLLLAGLDRATWDSVTARVQAAVTDEVIDSAVAAMPRSWTEADGGFLARMLRLRRDALDEAAERFYLRLAREVDVQATEADETGRVEILPGGEVNVTLRGPRRGEATYFQRRFVPSETREVRIYLRGGDDRALVTGGASPILVRVVAGAGHDALIDSTSTPGGVAFYADEGDRVVHRPDTRVDRRTWTVPAVTGYRPDEDGTFQDYGPPERSWTFEIDYRDGAGLVLGGGVERTSRGFRSDPWRHRTGGAVSVGTGNGGLGASIRHGFRPEGSRIVVELEAAGARDLAGERFYGFGNDSERVAPGRALVLGDEAWGRVRVRRPFSRGMLSAGPVVQYRDPEGAAEGPLDEQRPLGAGPFGQVGVEAELSRSLGPGGSPADPSDSGGGEEQGRAGAPAVDLALQAAAYPPLWDAPAWFGHGELEIRSHLPAGRMALRLQSGGRVALGRYPYHEAAYLGGRETLRGFRHQRFAGDLAAWGGVEWRVRLARPTLLTRGDLGVLGLLDAGRVWLEGSSPGGWHTGWGGGIWFRTLGFTAEVLWARGEEGRWYLGLGPDF